MTTDTTRPVPAAVAHMAAHYHPTFTWGEVALLAVALFTLLAIAEWYGERRARRLAARSALAMERLDVIDDPDYYGPVRVLPPGPRPHR